eukprot:m.218234 g.218234  ORF g.218234 m.218234 type:complete len:1005 (-) comp33261_c1_seq1:160-3174(-)
MAAKVLVIGEGGREHALAWKLAQSPKVASVLVGGIPSIPSSNTKISAPAGDYPGVKDHTLLCTWCKSNGIDLVVVGPEDPLVAGIVDSLTAAGVAAFGPTKAAAQLEGSKQWAHAFMERNKVPTSRYETFTSIDDACLHIDNADYPALVIKADGLAAGKGVVVAANKTDAKAAVRACLETSAFGAAGNIVVIEELLVGPEVSVFALTDGKHVQCMLPAQDHKRLLNGDKGPNTGGMGAYAPTPLCTEADMDAIREQVAQRTIDGMAAEGNVYTGLLYCQVMLTTTGPQVVEFNCRFGDPETQTLMMLMTSDLFEHLVACVPSTPQKLVDIPLSFHPDMSCITVVLASGGYPAAYSKGFPIKGLDTFANLGDDVELFHAGTKHNDTNEVVTSGGRVLAVCAKATTLDNAVDRVYQVVPVIQFEGAQHRTDIAGQVRQKTLTYADAGVSIHAGDSLVDRIKPVCKATKRTGCTAVIGGFGGVFDLKAVGYTDPLLISGTDGVGTKLEIAKLVNKHDTIGIDLVAMCVNDILAHGAEPLFFLDYFATGKLSVDQAADVVKGITAGCTLSGCALIGGETAEMPGLYQPGDYDVAGFSVGAVERAMMLPRSSEIKAGDVVIGLGSSGVHSNGFSLVRRVVAKSGFEYLGAPPFPHEAKSLGEALLTPTRIYVKSVLNVMRQNLVKAFAHITGGGIADNIARVIPDNFCASIDCASWTVPAMFRWIKSAGGISPSEMSKTFNCGIGGCLIVEASLADSVLEQLLKSGENAFKAGTISDTDGSVKVTLTNLAAAFEDLQGITLPQPKNKKKVGVLISGSGTNLQSLLDNAKDGGRCSHVEIAVVISNKADAFGLERAHAAGVKTVVIDHKKYPSREKFDDEVDAVLQANSVELVCLAGFMRLLSADFTHKWSGKMLNVHPSLLPSFKGVDAQKQALEAGVCVTGCTVHFVTAEMDAGAIIVQRPVAIENGDTVDVLVERIKEQEHLAFPDALECVATGKVSLAENNTCVRK